MAADGGWRMEDDKMWMEKCGWEKRMTKCGWAIANDKMPRDRDPNKTPAYLFALFFS